MRKVNCDVNECNKVDGNDENKNNETARRLLIDNAKMNTKTGVKDTEVVSTREKENGSDEGQTRTDSQATKPKAPTLSGFTTQQLDRYITILVITIFIF